jgi:hypothetical protein
MQVHVPNWVDEELKINPNEKIFVISGTKNFFLSRKNVKGEETIYIAKINTKEIEKKVHPLVSKTILSHTLELHYFFLPESLKIKKEKIKLNGANYSEQVLCLEVCPE